MASIGWFLLGIFVAPGASWWRGGRKGIGVIVASVSVALPLFMFLILPRFPRTGPVMWALSAVLALGLLVQSIIAAAALRRDARREPWSTTAMFTVGIILAGTPARLVPRTEFESFVAPSDGMRPSLIPGDQFFVLKDRKRYPLERGSVVVYAHPERGVNYVQRIIGIAGDQITDDAGQLLINGAPLGTEPCPPEEANPKCKLEVLGAHKWHVTPGFRFDGSTWTVPPGTVFVMGDNRDDSEDSRSFGAIPQEQVIGVARVIHLSIPNVLRSGKSIDPEP